MNRWTDIPGFEGSYQMHPDGRVRSVDREVVIEDSGTGEVRYTRQYKGRVLTLHGRPGGAQQVNLYIDGVAHGFTIKQLRARTFGK